ncbi:MAG: DUF2332 domain-containing protein [Geodermatophilaceae bacterium]|nr:DUF2332 domain-containing protein [Geodermatophilaceae bacterium]
MPHPLSAQFRNQSRLCLPGSPLSASLLAAAADDLDAGGPTAAVMLPYQDDGRRSVPPLRLLGGLHRLVLERQAPELALHYPSVGGTAPVRAAWPAARRLLGTHTERLSALAGRPVQTNEVGRCAALIGVLHVLTERYGLPIRLFEFGASAGLNLNVDRYAYAVDNRVLGAADSPLRLQAPWRGYPEADLARPVEIVERAGCDSAPVDASTTEGRLTLTSYVWADWIERLERLRTALAIAADHPITVAASAAAPWLAHRLGWPRTGSLTLVWHSVVWQYVDIAERTELERILQAAADRATPTAPLALAGMEYVDDSRFEVRLRTWPERRHDLLATTAGHGMPATWLNPAQPDPAPVGPAMPVV